MSLQPETISFASQEERQAVTQGSFFERMVVMGWLMGGCWMLFAFPTAAGTLGAVVLLGLCGLGFYGWARNILEARLTADHLTLEAAKVTRRFRWADVRWVWLPKVPLAWGGPQVPLLMRTTDAVYYFQIKNSRAQAAATQAFLQALGERVRLYG